MKIRVAILEKDAAYLGRLVSAFGMKYADKLEVYSFTDPGAAGAVLSDYKIDVFLVGDQFPEAIHMVGDQCASAFLVNSSDVEALNGIPAISRFQKIDLIYKQILGVYSEKAGGIVGKSSDVGDAVARVYCFTSPAGGTGASSLAAACAIHYAKKGYRAMYLNLEAFGAADEYFTADGVYSMSDVIYAMSSGKANLPLRLESCVRQDPRGVSFYSRPKVALDMLEFHSEDMCMLVRQLRTMNSYDIIIVDMDFSLDGIALQVMGEADAVIWASDGTSTANGKLLNALEAVKILDSSRNLSLERRLCMIYNKFSNKSGVTIPEGTIRLLGGAPRFDQATSAQVIEKLADKQLFDGLE